MATRVALYLRVSTKAQTVENQRLELERWAAARGYEIVETYTDHGISGSKGRDKRPAFDRLLKNAVRRRFDIVAAWSVDRVGRSLQHLVVTLSELHAAGCDLYLHQQALDTTTPSGKAMFGMSSVFAEFERSMIVARVNAGLDRARSKGIVLGRPTLSRKVRDTARAALRSGSSVRASAKLSGASIGAVAGLRKELVLSGGLIS